MMTIALLSMTVTFAENENVANVNNVEAYDMSVNMRKLSVALGLTSDQIEAVESIHQTFNAEMQFAAMSSSDDRKAKVDEAVDKDVKWMRYVLNDKQFRKYLLLLNTTLSNRGLR
jgi:hypothetical protein